MVRGFWVGLVVVALCGAVAIWLTATSTFLYRHPNSPETRIVMDYTTGSAVVASYASSQAKAANAEVAVWPRAVVPEREHDFGTMNPLSLGRHEFVIRNEGDAALELRVGPTTCSCTVSGLEKKKLQPGEETIVSMDWDTGRSPEFGHSATIHTNDPSRKSVHFTVRGKVRVLVASEPQELPLAAADPDSRSVAEVLLHSQLWHDLQVVQVDAPLKDLEWRVEKVDPAQLPGLNAQSVQKLHCEFTNPGQGRFAEVLQVTLKDGTGEQPLEKLSIPISGSIKRRLSFYGPAIDSLGVIDLGNISEGQPKQVKLIAKVRDEIQSLENVKIEVFPEFATATMEPHPGGQPGMYQLVIAIPPGIEPCQYKANPSGRIMIHTEHPRIGDVELGLSFAIVPRAL